MCDTAEEDQDRRRGRRDEKAGNGTPRSRRDGRKNKREQDHTSRPHIEAVDMYILRTHEDAQRVCSLYGYGVRSAAHLLLQNPPHRGGKVLARRVIRDDARVMACTLPVRQMRRSSFDAGASSNEVVLSTDEGLAAVVRVRTSRKGRKEDEGPVLLKLNIAIHA